MAVKSRTQYTSKGIVGTIKLGHTDASILRSMCSGTKKKKMYDLKELPTRPEIAAKRHEKKRQLRLKKRQSNQ